MLDFIFLSILYLMMFFVLIILLMPLRELLLYLYIKTTGVKTKAVLKLIPRSYKISYPRQTRYLKGHKRSTADVSAIYKANKIRYVEKPLNDCYSLCYQHNQSVEIKYWKQNPKYFIVL